MGCTFKIGDIVRAKVDKYFVTYFHRPCMVVNESQSDFRVVPFDSKGSYKRNFEDFELVPAECVFNEGEYLYNKKLREVVIFIRYDNNCSVYCKTLDGNYVYDDIRDLVKVGDNLV